MTPAERICTFLCAAASCSHIMAFLRKTQPPLHCFTQFPFLLKPCSSYMAFVHVGPMIFSPFRYIGIYTWKAHSVIHTKLWLLLHDSPLKNFQVWFPHHMPIWQRPLKTHIEVKCFKVLTSFVLFWDNRPTLIILLHPMIPRRVLFQWTKGTLCSFPFSLTEGLINPLPHPSFFSVAQTSIQIPA